MRFLFHLDLSLHAGAEIFFGILNFGTEHGLIIIDISMVILYFKKKEKEKENCELMIFLFDLAREESPSKWLCDILTE